MLTLFFCVLIAALVFEYINGFHDAANAIATVVSTKVLTPRQAILLAAACNLIGAFVGTAVAKAIWKDFVYPHAATMGMVLAGLVGAIVWNLLTWWWGLPSSSSHARYALRRQSSIHSGSFFLPEMKRTVSSLSPLGANSCSMSDEKPHS